MAAKPSTVRAGVPRGTKHRIERALLGGAAGSELGVGGEQVGRIGGEERGELPALGGDEACMRLCGVSFPAGQPTSCNYLSHSFAPPSSRHPPYDRAGPILGSVAQLRPISGPVRIRTHATSVSCPQPHRAVKDPNDFLRSRSHSINGRARRILRADPYET
eukprot:scaffold6603_cov78-Isochrysis_galbana.AAC.1